MSFKMASAAPSAKVYAATAAALLTPILLGVLAKAFPTLPLPVDANDLVQQLIEGAVVGLLTFAAGYLKSPNAVDVAIPNVPTPPAGGIPPV